MTKRKAQPVRKKRKRNQQDNTDQPNELEDQIIDDFAFSVGSDSDTSGFSSSDDDIDQSQDHSGSIVAQEDIDMLQVESEEEEEDDDLAEYGITKQTKIKPPTKQNPISVDIKVLERNIKALDTTLLAKLGVSEADIHLLCTGTKISSSTDTSSSQTIPGGPNSIELEKVKASRLIASRLHKHPKWSKYKFQFKKHLMCLLKIFSSSLHDIDPNLSILCLEQLERATPLLDHMPKLAKKCFLLVLSKFWTNTDSNEFKQVNTPEEEEEEEDSHTSVTIGEKLQSRSHLVLRRMILSFPYPFIKFAYNQCWKTFFFLSKKYNPHTFKTVQFCSDSLVDLLTIDVSVSLDLGQRCITSFAKTLQQSYLNIAASKNKSKKSKNQDSSLFTFQYVSSLEIWGKLFILKVSSDEVTSKQLQTPLFKLIYPWTQVVLGSIQRVSSPLYYPYSLYLLKLLFRVQKNIGLFIPIFPHITQILSNPIWERKRHALVGNPFDWDYSLKSTEDQLKSDIFQSAVLDQSVSLIKSLIEHHQSLPGYTDFCIPIKLWIKSQKSSRRQAELKSIGKKLNL